MKVFFILFLIKLKNIMYIFLDESKRFNKNNKKIVFWWLITNLKPSTIDTLYYDFLDEKWIKEINWEIKSYEKKYEKDIFDFHNFLKNHRLNNDIEFVWAYSEWYTENWNNYYKILIAIIKYVVNKNKFNLKKIIKVNIIADHLKLSFKERDIKNMLNNDSDLDKDKKRFAIQKFNFEFTDSKRYWWVKFSDFIAWILRKKYIAEEWDLPYLFEEHLVWWDIIIVKLK